MFFLPDSFVCEYSNTQILEHLWKWAGLSLELALWIKISQPMGHFTVLFTIQVLFEGHAKFSALLSHLVLHIFQYLSFLGQQIKALVVNFTARQRVAQGLALPTAWTHFRQCYFLLWTERIGHQDLNK